MYNWMISLEDKEKRLYLDIENELDYFNLEKLFIIAIMTFMDNLMLRKLQISDLCHYVLLNELVLENDMIEIDELKQYYITRFELCISRYDIHYSHEIKKLFFNVRNGLWLDKKEVINILKLKFRSNICYFKLFCEQRLIIDFCEDSVFIRSDTDCLGVIDQIKNIGLCVTPLPDELVIL